jgi:aspartyl-tRNA(Asn)/glutamyl-tRNA(Gln) amidotransferase subunit A
MTIVKAAAAMRARRISSEELTRNCLRRLREREGLLNAYITVAEESALAEARARDAELARGIDRGPLHGIPIAHKDLIDTKDLRTTCGSLLYKDRVPGADATVVARLREAGAVLIGKTGLHELAYGITSTNPHFGAIRNPHDPTRIPGGSSGGSGVAVATGSALMATGTDTGGSIRIPCSFCGVTGLKPTFGSVSKQGVLPLGYSLDHIGPMTRNVRDAALCFAAMAGPDEQDETTAAATRFSLPSGVLDRPSLRSVRIGLPAVFEPHRFDLEVHSAVRKAFQTAAALGAQIVDVDLPDMAELSSCSLNTLLAEAAHVHRQHLDRPELFGADVFALLARGRVLSAADYIESQRQRVRLCREWMRVWSTCDLLILPATPTPAPRIGENTITLQGRQENVRILATSWVRGFNLLGWPVLTMPCGKTESGLPLGMQLIGPPHSEERLLIAGAALEDALGVPPLT